MSADELYATTMDPNKRQLVPLTTDDFAATIKLYDELMGKSALLRKNFILKNKLSKIVDEDSYDDYDDSDDE